MDRIASAVGGPVLSVLRAGSFEEAAGLVNAHEYGNGTAIFIRDGAVYTFPTMN